MSHDVYLCLYIRVKKDARRPAPLCASFLPPLTSPLPLRDPPFPASALLLFSFLLCLLTIGECIPLTSSVLMNLSCSIPLFAAHLPRAVLLYVSLLLHLVYSLSVILTTLISRYMS